jgi:hypothetical protein
MSRKKEEASQLFRGLEDGMRKLESQLLQKDREAEEYRLRLRNIETEKDRLEVEGEPEQDRLRREEEKDRLKVEGEPKKDQLKKEEEQDRF